MGDNIMGLTKDVEFLPRLVSMVMVAALIMLMCQGEEALDKVTKILFDHKQ